MLASTIPGEAMAAREAFLRLAHSERFGPHELADALCEGARTISPDKLSTNQMAQRCWDWFEENKYLSEKEQKFVRDMMVWHHPSEKQIAWLTTIYERMRGS